HAGPFNNFGEGQTFIGSALIDTDSAGRAEFSLFIPTPIAPGKVITATATDWMNNSSEFSACQVVALPAARVFASVHGADITPCSAPAPCRTLSHAVLEVELQGEVIVVDSGDYDPFTITQGVSIRTSPRSYVGITVTSGFGVRVSVGASEAVTLSGLTIV